MATGMIALVRGVTQARTLAGSMVQVSRSISANTGTAPACSTANAVLDMVSGGTITSSPGPTPAAARAACNVAVPLMKEIANLDWKTSANLVSSRFVITLPADDRNCES